MRRLFMVLSCLLSLSAQAGPRDGGGGDEVGLEFQAALETAIKVVISSNLPLLEPIQKLDWTKVKRDIKVLVVDAPLYVEREGVRQETVATNEPNRRRIKINRPRWNQLSHRGKKEGIALHEVLSLEGIESTGVYSYSGIYFSLYGFSHEDTYGKEGERVVPMPGAVARVYSYKCRRRFLEGEGVSENGVNCPAHQNLGLISSEYSFYLNRGPTRDNFHEKITEVNYESSICGAQITKLSCDYAPQPAFGLSENREGEFTVQVMLMASPESNTPASTRGYAVLPDANGSCPTNLVKVRPWVAQPASITSPLSSNFINSSNRLNSIMISSSQPEPMQVWRHPAGRSCDSMGRCGLPQGGNSLNQTVSYFPLTPVVCVIPVQSIQNW